MSYIKDQGIKYFVSNRDDKLFEKIDDYFDDENIEIVQIIPTAWHDDLSSSASEEHNGRCVTAAFVIYTIVDGEL